MKKHKYLDINNIEHKNNNNNTTTTINTNTNTNDNIKMELNNDNNIMLSNDDDNSSESSGSSAYETDNKGYLIFKYNLKLNYRYEIKKQLGKGTFSRVFKALDTYTNSFKAIKVIRNIYKYQVRYIAGLLIYIMCLYILYIYIG